MRIALAIIAMLCATSPVVAQDFVLSSPIDCSLDDDCYIQQYVDHTEGQGASDFHCSTLSYDRHKGTDFAVRTLQKMKQGVNILASAAGTVKAVRRGVEDRIYSAGNADQVSGRECGNGVVINHQDGWETQYCHMKKGSIKVRKGQVVRAGTVLGQIGLSGRTQFPHLHLSVRKDGKVIDPFDPDGKVTCGVPDPNSMWKKPLPYRPGGILYAGFSDGIPKFKDVKSGTAAKTSMPADAPALVIFGFGFGARKGDQMRLILKGPNGTLVDSTVGIDKNQAQLFKASGKRLTKASWPKGHYTGSASLIRNGRVINVETTKLTVR